MKRHICLLLTILFTISTIAFPSMAITPSPQLIVEEYTDTENRIIRTLSIPSTQTTTVTSRQSDNTSVEQADAILLALGYTQYAVDTMPTEEKLKYLDGTDFFSVTSYLHFDANNNAELVSESEALAQAALFNSTAQNGARNSTSNTYEDSYMRLGLLAYKVAGTTNGKFFFSLRSEWLTSPFYRFTDVAAIAVADCVVVPNTAYSYFQYETTLIDSGIGGGITELGVTQDTYDYSSSNYVEDQDGGVAFKYNLPNNIENDTVQYLRNSIVSYVSYNGCVSHPELVTNFNLYGVYSHNILTLDLSPSISFDPDGTAPGVSIGAGLNHEDRTVSAMITYTP